MFDAHKILPKQKQRYMKHCWLLLLVLLACGDSGNLTNSDYELFKETPAWNLAKAVRDGNEGRIKDVLKAQPVLINYQEPKYGSTLLMLTIENQEPESFLNLLSLKADVRIHDTYDGSSALIKACRYDYFDILFVEALLEAGADPNDVEVGPRRTDNHSRNTPLISAVKSGKREFVVLLIDHGAEVNYQDEFGHSALTTAVLQDHYDIVLYLLQKGANYRHPIFVRPVENSEVYLVDALRQAFFPLNSKQHKLKMEVVEFLKGKGLDYKNAPIPDFIVKKAQKEYPDSWQEFLEKY